MGLRSAQVSPDLPRAKSILVLRLDQIGDVVLTTPFLRELRRNAPQAWITLVVKPAILNLVELCPYVDEVITYDWNTPRPFSRLRRHVRALRLARKGLWGHQFDLAIVPRFGADRYHATFLAYFSGARRRVGHAENVTEEKVQLNAGYDRLYTDVVHDPTPKHEVEHNLDVIRYLGGQVEGAGLEAWLNEKDNAFALDFLQRRGVRPHEYLMAFAPGAGFLRKQWPVENFADLGQRLQREFPLRILVLGGAEDNRLGEELGREVGGAVLNLAGRTALRETLALLRHCRVYIGNDTGPMHLAAATGVPVVLISCHPECGPIGHENSPVRFGPWGVKQVIIQPKSVSTPCRESCEAGEPHCILQVDVGWVEEGVRGLISSVENGPAINPIPALRLREAID